MQNVTSVKVGYYTTDLRRNTEKQSTRTSPHSIDHFDPISNRHHLYHIIDLFYCIERRNGDESFAAQFEEMLAAFK